MGDETIKRRAFLATAAGWLSTLILLALSACGLGFVLDPLGTKKQAGKKQRIAPLDNVPADKPLRVVVRADRWDAYVHHPPGPIGTVWLTRNGSDGDASKVRCFQAACPHLGCGIDYAPDRDAYYCPCHVSEFGPDGARRLGPTPRGMDELVATVTEPDKDGKRWVEIEYAEFVTGTAEKKQV
jgi:quinol---cytochrome c reductase iron-sulfur subunit, bacillus type